MNSGVLTSADETKLFRVIKTRTDCAELQRSLVKSGRRKTRQIDAKSEQKGKNADATTHGFGIILIGTVLWECQIRLWND